MAHILRLRRRPLKVGSGHGHSDPPGVWLPSRRPLKVGSGQGKAAQVCQAFLRRRPLKVGSGPVTTHQLVTQLGCRRPLKVGSGPIVGLEFGVKRCQSPSPQGRVGTFASRRLHADDAGVAVPSRSGRDGQQNNTSEVRRKCRRPLKVGSGPRQNLGFWWRYGSKGVDGCSRPSVG